MASSPFSSKPVPSFKIERDEYSSQVVVKGLGAEFHFLNYQDADQFVFDTTRRMAALLGHSAP
jgi:hypothetical protein